MKKKTIGLLLAAGLCAQTLAGCAAPAEEYVVLGGGKADVIVDFSARIGTEVQNLKKFDQFSPTWNYVSGNTANFAALDQNKDLRPLQAENFRIDCMFGVGGIGNAAGNGPGLKGTTDAEWAVVNEVVDSLEANGVVPYLCMVGIPKYGQADEFLKDCGHKTYPGDNLDRYLEFCENAARYYRQRGNRVVFETWNEPDLSADAYWMNGMPAFIDTSVAAALAYKRGNPDAVVAELGLCWPLTQIADGTYNDPARPELRSIWDYYLAKSHELGNRIDAFSWHIYGSPGAKLEGNENEKVNFSYWKKQIRDKIAASQEQYPDLETMQQHVTEYSPASSFDDAIVQVATIPAFYEAIQAGLDSTDISRFSWCSYLTDRFGLIDPVTYCRRPVYYALWTYGQLPVGRVAVPLGERFSTDLGAMAGVDDHRAGVVVWNRNLPDDPNYSYDAKLTRSVRLSLRNIPFGVKSFKAYLVDSHHVSDTSAQNEPYLVLNRRDLGRDDMTVTLNVPGNAAIYLVANDESGSYRLEQASELADHIVRKDYYYSERGDRKPYADLHENSFSAYIGMGDNARGKSALCVTLDDLAVRESLDVSYRTWGDLDNAAADAALGFRVDYHTPEGYVKADWYFVDDLGATDFAVGAFGTGRAPDGKLRSLGGRQGRYSLPLRRNAPAAWDGRIQITYLIRNAGPGATAEFFMN